MFLMCLVLCFDIFRNPHAQNAWVTHKSAAIGLQSRPTSRYVGPISSPRRIEFTWKPNGNCDGTLIWGTHDAIFNRISLKLELKKSDFQINRIQ